MARRKAGDKKVVGKKNRAASEETSHVQADQYSIAFEELHVAGNVGGDIRIGHTIGYTAEQVSVLLKQITTTLQPKPFDGRCPYKGLEVFEEEDAELFFGRERLVNELVGRVKESRTVFITGPSGSGKSSLVRAGLIHALKQGAIKSSDRWLYETLKPGREPLKDLALAFSRLKSPELQDYFLTRTSEPEILNRCAESVLSSRKDQRFLLFVDQFEEIFTQINSEEERIAFINMLAHSGTVENGRVIVLFAMRSDFVSNCATYPALNELLSQEFRQIGAMQPEELVSAIALPARHVGLPVEHELIAQIINDMRGEPDALPLMQFALKDLFDAKQAEGGVVALTLKDYLGHGGIHKSLERHADATFAKLSESEQELTRSIFSGLIEIGRGTQDTKRTALFEELVPANTKAQDVEIIVRKLADARLIITDEQAGKDTVTISHEKLIEAWPWLKKLVNENRDAIALQNEIASDAKEWEDHKRDVSYLYSGARLANISEQLDAKKLVLSETSNEFVKEGQGQEQRNQRTRILGVAIPIGLVILAIVVVSYIVNTNSTNAAKRSEEFATTQQAAASTSDALASIAQANAEEAKLQTEIALARQLAAQAQSVLATGYYRRPTAVLLAVQSMRLFPSVDAEQILRNNTLPRWIAGVTHNDPVSSVAISSDSKYVVSASADGTARVWEAATGNEIARMTSVGIVSSVAFSPDGKYIVSGSWDDTARVWEAATGNEIARMVHDDDVFSVAFSPDSKYVVSASADGIARVWEAATGNEIARMIHDDEAYSVAFSPDGKYVVSGSWDDTARVWEAATGNEIARMVHDDNVFSVAISPDSKYVVSASADSTARVWEAATGNEIARMIHDDEAYSVAFSPDGKYVVSGSWDDTARVWEAATGNEIARMVHDDDVFSVAFSPDSKYVVSGSTDRTARVWERETGNEISLMLHNEFAVIYSAGIVSSVAFSSDGKYVISGGGDNTARVWEASTSREVARMTHDYIVYSVAFSPDGSYMISGGVDGTARVWEVVTGNEIVRTLHEGTVFSVAFSPDDKYVVSGGNDWIVSVSEVAEVDDIAYLIHDGPVSSVAISPDSKYVVSGSEDGTARVWEAATGNEIARMTYEGPVSSVAISPDSKYVVSGSEDGTARVWEAATGNEIARMTYEGPVSSVAISPDGKYVVSGSEDGTARVWEAATGNEIARMIHNEGVSSVTFSPDSSYVVSSGCDKVETGTEGFAPCLQGSAIVWEAATGNEIALMIHDGDVHSVAFSPDGKYVASGGEDNTARIWEAATGNEIARTIHDGDVYSVAFSPDGKYVASGSEDRTARVWFYHPEDLIAYTCSRLTLNLTRDEWKQYIGNAMEYQAVCSDLPIEPTTTPTVAP